VLKVKLCVGTRECLSGTALLWSCCFKASWNIRRHYMYSLSKPAILNCIFLLLLLKFKRSHVFWAPNLVLVECSGTGQAG
jgi:hypothetical protein